MSTVNFKKVRDDYSLTSFFTNTMGVESKNVSGRVRFSACPKCGPSSDLSVKVSVRNNKWHCFACNQKGDVIDAAAAFFDSSLADAAMQLVGNSEPMPARQSWTKEPEIVKNQEAINKVIALLLDAQKAPDEGVVSYLEGRGIAKCFTASAIFRKLVITLPSDPNVALRHLLDVVGRDLLLESGIWKEGSKCPAIVYRPLGFVSSDRQGIEFRMIAESAVAVAKAIRYGEPSVSVWKGNHKALIVEGSVDMLSAVCLGTERTIYSIPGASNWAKDALWLQGLQGKNVLLALDADEAGKAGATELEKVLTNLGSPTKRHSMPDGCKDLNDELMSKRHS
jgi:hypothetical protein